MKIRRLLSLALIICMVIPMLCFHTNAYTVCDLNGDGKINSIDAIMMRQLFVGSYSLASGTKRADVNGDSKVNAIDLSMLAMYIVGKLDITKAVNGGFYPVGDGADKYELYLENRVGTTVDDVVLGIGDNELYSMDFSDYEDDGYVIKVQGTEVLLFGKTSEGLGNASRAYARAVEAGEKPTNLISKGTGSKLSPVFQYWQDWGGAKANFDIVRKPDGTLPRWDWVEAKKIGATYIHPIYWPKDENGDDIPWQPNTKDLKELYGSMTWEIEQTHKAGIKLMAYTASCQFVIAEAEKMGYELMEFAALRDGEPRYDTDFNTYMPCINSTQWRDWVRENIKNAAAVGFDGAQYDYNLYGRDGAYCECERCQESWAKYSAEKTGKAQPYMMNGVTYTADMTKWFYRWKVQTILDFFEYTLSGAREINPDFEFIMNECVINFMFGEIALSGIYFTTSTEYVGVDIGGDSSIYMHKLSRALGYETPIAIFTLPEQFKNENGLKISISEAYAAGGIESVYTYSSSKQFLQFSLAYPELFQQKSNSVAKTAILYSADSALIGGEGNHSAIYAGKGMGASGALFDYLIIEKEDALEKLDDYDVFVIPDYKSFESSIWEPIIKKVLTSGKDLIVVGSTSKRYVNKFMSGATTNVYNVASYHNISSTLEKTKAYDILCCENAVENGLEFSVMRFGEDYDVIHLIHYSLLIEKSYETVEFTYVIPDGKTVECVTGYCPYGDTIKDYHVDVDWYVEDGILHITTGEFDTHCLMHVEYK